MILPGALALGCVASTVAEEDMDNTSFKGSFEVPVVGEVPETVYPFSTELLSRFKISFTGNSVCNNNIYV